MPEISEWTIENISCWNGHIHSDSLPEKSTFQYTCYPRGVGGNGEDLVVKIRSSFPSEGCEMSFIGSDGYVFCTKRANADSEGGYLIFTGPKFEEVVSRIRGNEPQHKDLLILRWEKPAEKPSWLLSTVIVADSLFFHLKPETLVSNSWSLIFVIIFTLRDVSMGTTIVKAFKTGYTVENSKIKFKVESNSQNKYLVRTSISMVNGGNIIHKHEEDCLFDKQENRILSYEIPLKELFEKGVITIMRCKIVSGRVNQKIYSSDFTLPPDIRITDLFCERNSLENTSNVISNPTRESNLSSVKRELQTENAGIVLREDLMCLYQDHDFSDFELRCGTVSFPTQRDILSSRSPVLKAMLSGDMREASCGHVDVEDLDPHTLGRFLAFLYSGATGEALQWGEASKLYYAADKYQVPSLKQECTAVLCASVSLESVCDILSLSDKHQDEELRSVAHDFILENYNEVVGSENWEKFMSSDSLLALKTLTHFAKNKYVKKSASN